jgi:hypothetical protein
LTAWATVSVAGASKVFGTRKVKRSLAANKRKRLTLKFSKRATGAIRHALARHRKLTAKVKVVAKDSSGKATAKRKIKLLP